MRPFLITVNTKINSINLLRYRNIFFSKISNGKIINLPSLSLNVQLSCTNKGMILGRIRKSKNAICPLSNSKVTRSREQIKVSPSKAIPSLPYVSVTETHIISVYSFTESSLYTERSILNHTNPMLYQ